tara:strand:- start:75 stop:542 length:468 start_codon:yes stop_codon:yes gene_type:complete
MIQIRGGKLFLFYLIIICSIKCSDNTWQDNEEWLFSEIATEFWRIEESINRDLIILKNGKLDKKTKEKVSLYEFIDKGGNEIIDKIKNSNEIDHKLYLNICSFIESLRLHISKSDMEKFETIIKKNKNINKYKMISLIKLTKLKVFQSVFKGINM